ncbi:MAG: hypothetical protein NZM31_06915 [Gemmatales bacterium]|nr:hypothetical protein [Gemmatales bacterium]MDW8386732.1 hypothetical protein [Gemmatales bacterium]
MSTQEFAKPRAICMPSPIDMGEPHSVGIAYYRNPQEMLLYLRSLRHVSDGNLLVVIGIRNGSWVSPLEIPPNVRFVYTADDDAVDPHDFAGWYEPNPLRAVVLAMMNLKPNEGLILLMPADWSGPAVEYLIDQGRRWRASHEVPEDGRVHPIDDPA